MIWILPLAILSGLLYYIGGCGKETISWANTKFRDLGCPLVAVGAVLLIGGRSWWLALSGLLLFGAMTMYWKKGPKSLWWNWALCGLGYSISWLPFCYFNHSLFGLLCYTIIVVAVTTLWSEWLSDAFWEQWGRGFIVVAAVPLLLWRF